MVRPGSTEEVAAVVAACARAGVAVVPQGGNTGLVGGGVPDASGSQVVLSLGRMRRVREVDPVAGTVAVDAGVVLADVQAAAEKVDRLFPMSLGSEGSCTIGGNISTNAGGTAVLRYGMTRELVLGLEVVLPDGRVWDGLRGLRKDNTGYDLTQLFVGAEGTLGVITGCRAAALPGHPAARHGLGGRARPSTPRFPCSPGPAARGRAPVDVRDRQPAGHRPRPRPPARRERPARRAERLVRPGRAAGSASDAGLDEILESLLGEAVEAGTRRRRGDRRQPGAAVGPVGPARGHLRGAKVEGAALKHDVTLPIARLAEWATTIGPRLQEVCPGVRLVTYGHVGDGNLHYNLNAPWPTVAATTTRSVPRRPT